MSNVFISYSRNDLTIAEIIVSALAETKLDTWIDWKSIPKGEKFEREIYQGIEGANVFLFLISPASVQSDWCKKEIAHATINNKRIIPILIQDTDENSIPLGISERNWIDCREKKDGFRRAIEEILKTIHADYEWVKYQTRLQVKALDWERRKDNSRLLRGKELQEAEQQLAIAGSQKDPQPTDLQRNFVLTSRKAEQDRRKTTIGIAIGVTTIVCLFCVIAIVGGSIAYIQNQTAATAQVQVTEQKNIADTRQLATIAQNLSMDDGHTAILSGLLAVEAARRYPELESNQALRRYLNITALPISNIKFDGSVEEVDFSSDGKWAVASSLDGTVRIWNMATNEEAIRLKLSLTPFVSYVKFSPNGKWLVFTDCEKYEEGAVQGHPNCNQVVARIFDTETWQEVSLIKYDYNIDSFAFSPDSNRLVTGGNDGTIRIWDINSSKEIAHTPKSDFTISIVAFSPDGKFVVSDFNNTLAVVWDASTGLEVSHINHEDGVTFVTFNPNGEWVASASYDGTIKVWEAHTGKVVTNIILEKSSAFLVSFSPDGKWLVSSDNDNTVRAWDVSTGQEISKVAGNGGVTSVAFSPDNKLIASAGISMVRVWDVATGNEVTRMFHDGYVLSVAFSPNGKNIISGSEDGTARIWEVNAYQDVSHTISNGYISSVVLSPNGKWGVSGSEDGTTRVWDVVTGKEISKMTIDGSVLTIDVSSNSEWIAQGACEGQYVACGNPVVRIWEALTGKEVYQLKPDFAIRVVKFTPDGKNIVLAGDHGSIQLWNLDSGQLISKYEPDLTGAEASGRAGSFIEAMDVDPNGKWVVAGSHVAAEVWELNSTQKVYKMNLDGGISTVAFSSNGEWVASAGNVIRIWKADSGEEVALIPLDPTAQSVYSLAFSSDNKWLVGGVGTTERIWEISTGKEISRIEFSNIVHSVDFSPDGKWIASGSYDNTARIWIWQPEDLIAEVCKRLPRNLTHEEWKQFIGSETYQPTCPNLPIPAE